MYLDRRDIRGLLIVAAVFAFSLSITFFVRTLDLPAGIFVGRTHLLAPRIGDSWYLGPFWISAAIGGVAAIAASCPYWNR
jgi:hypothetical protein